MHQGHLEVSIHRLNGQTNMGLDVVSYRMGLCLYSLDLLHSVPIGVQMGPTVCTSSFIQRALPYSFIAGIH